MSTPIITQGAGAGLSIPITVSLPAFPNVPLLAGVPQLARSILYPPSPAPTIQSQGNQGALWQSTQSGPVWGVFDQSNNLVIDADSVHDFGWRQEYRVSNFPVQQGQFASYNKVTLPFECSIILTKGGSLTSRQNFLAQIDAVAASLDLFNIITPEKTYLNCNVTRPELTRRGAANAFYFDVELFFVQIKEVTPQYSNSGTSAPSTANSSVPSAVPPTNQGLNNPQVPSSAVQSSALSAITPPTPTG